MKLLKATFNRVNLTQVPARYPLTAVRIPELFQCLGEMPIRDELLGEQGDSNALMDAVEEDGLFIYDYGTMEPTTIPGFEIGEVHTFEFLIEVEPASIYTSGDVQMVVRGYVEGDPTDKYAKYHITSTMTFRNYGDDDTLVITNNTLFCQSEDKDCRTLRAADGVNIHRGMVECDNLGITELLDVNSTFHTGVQSFDAMEVSRSYYLSRIINETIRAEDEFIGTAVVDNEQLHTLISEQLSFPKVAYHLIVRLLRGMRNEAHRTMCLDKETLDELFGEVDVTEFNNMGGIRPVADTWDNSIESKVAYTIFQYLHGEIANLGVETLELEIDEDGPVDPKYATFKGMDKGPQTYADIYKVAEDIHEQFACQGNHVAANINFNINGVSTVEVTVDGAPKRTFEYASFASSYCNPLVTKNADRQKLLAETYITIREIIS